MTFEYKIPDEKAPGFLRRERMRRKYLELTKAGGAGQIDAMLDWLVLYVTKPADPDKAREALEDISQEVFDKLVSDISGVTGEPDPKAQDAPETG